MKQDEKERIIRETRDSLLHEIRSVNGRAASYAGHAKKLKLQLDRMEVTVREADERVATMNHRVAVLEEENERLKATLRSDPVNPDGERLNMVIDDQAKQISDLHDALDQKRAEVYNIRANLERMQADYLVLLDRLNKPRTERGYLANLWDAIRGA